MFYQSIKASIVSIIFFSLTYAENRDDYNYPKQNINSDCDKSKSSRECNDILEDQVITPDAGPKVAHGADVFLTADFIYWISREDGLGFAYNGATAAGGPVPANAGKGSVKHIDWNGDPGFKVGAGINLFHDGWDLFLEYTWLRSNPSKNSISIPTITASTSIKPLWDIAGNNLPDSDLIFASGNWDLHFNVIHFEVGRNYYISKYLTLRPFVGLKGSWQDEAYTVRYVQDGDIGYRMQGDQDYWSVGIRIGSNNAWYFTRNWSLYGNWALSALWAHFAITRKDFFTPDIADPDDTFLNRFIENDFYSLKGILELALGVRYDLWFYHDDYHFSISAGWDEQIWFSQNQRFKYFEESAHGDLVLQGLTIKARFDF